MIRLFAWTGWLKAVYLNNDKHFLFVTGGAYDIL